MPRFHLMNAKEMIIHSFDAVDLVAARDEMRRRCLQDRTSYALAIVIRRGLLSESEPVKSVEDQPA